MGEYAHRIRELLAREEVLQMPSVGDVMSGLLAKQAGFEALAVGGYALGAASGTTEPLMTMTECVEAARAITHRTDLPVLVDVGAAFGEPLHTWRTVREFEAAGIAAIHLEDQLFPKRAHYHKGVEHLIPTEDMVDKIHAAVEARKDPDFLIVARTDAMLVDGYAEGVERARRYVEAGADAVMAFPNSDEEMRQAPSDIPADMVYVVSDGNRLGRPVPTLAELADIGYRMAYYATTATLVHYESVGAALKGLKETGVSPYAGEDDRAIRLRKGVEDIIGLDAAYALEERTVERRTS